MPPIRTQTPSKADLLQRRIDINAELRRFRAKYDKPHATETPGDVERIESLAAERDQIEVELERAADNPSRPAYDRVFRVGTQEGTYRADYAVVGGHSFLRDLAMGQVLRDPGALDRLARHSREIEVDMPAVGQQQRAIGSGAVTGLVPPAYLTAQFAELARAGRPVANACTGLPLPPEGMTVNISRITTGTSAASQSTENSAVSQTDADDTLLTSNVCTIAGQQTISRQAVERGQLVEQVIMADLANAHNAELDRQVVNGAGGSGQHLGILGVSGVTAVTCTDATPTPQELWPKLADAVRQVGALRFTRATHLIMNPLTWGWLLSTLDTTGRPLFAVGGSESGFNTMGASDTAGYYLSGSMLGCGVLLSGNVPTNLGGGTNETRIVAADMRDIYLWENDGGGGPVFIRAEQPSAASLGILYVAYSFSAFAAGRQPKAISVVSGTGLILPAL
jgi:HK97 family phage major capsid protein